MIWPRRPRRWSSSRWILKESQRRKLLEVPAEKHLAIQVDLGTQPGGPLTMSVGRRGIDGGGWPPGFGPVVDGSILPHHPFDPAAPAISKGKPLIVGYNRDVEVSALTRWDMGGGDVFPQTFKPESQMVPVRGDLTTVDDGIFITK